MGTAVIAAYLVRPSASIDFFFDEMWRVDFIRAVDPIERMFTHDTPVPLGWIYLSI